MTHWTLESISEAVGIDLSSPDRRGGNSFELVQVRESAGRGGQDRAFEFSFRGRDLVLTQKGTLVLKVWIDGADTIELGGGPVRIRDIVWAGRAPHAELLRERWAWLIDGGPPPRRTLTARKRRRLRRLLNKATRMMRHEDLSRQRFRKMMWDAYESGIGVRGRAT